jgi:hypothetical protein
MLEQPERHRTDLAATDRFEQLEDARSMALL